LRQSFEWGESAATQAVSGGCSIFWRRRWRDGRRISRYAGICGRGHGVPYRLIGDGASDTCRREFIQGRSGTTF
jgi:hypothetical protein